MFRRRAEGAGAKPEKEAAQLLPFKEIYESGVIRADNSTYALLLQFKNAPYLSQTEREQEAIYERYKQLLNGLSPAIHYQELIYSRPIDREGLENLMLSKRSIGNSYLDDHNRTLQRFANEILVDVTEREYIAVLSVTVSEKNTTESPMSILVKAAKALETKFYSLGSAARILDAKGALKVFYELYNPYSQLSFQMPNGRKSYIEVIAPGDVNEKAKSLELGEHKVRVYAAWSYGATLDDNFLTSLLHLNCRVAASKHIVHLPKDKAIDRVTSRLKALEADRQDRLKKNRQSGESYVPLDLESNIANCRELLTRLNGDDNLFGVKLLVSAIAKDEEELREVCNVLQNKAAEHYVQLKPLLLQQSEAWEGILPLGTCKLKTETLMLTNELSVMLPFSTPGFIDRNGIYYGQNVNTGEPVIINRKQDKNSNGFLFGKSGSGKSFYGKLEITSLMTLPWCCCDEIIVVDPDGEFVSLAKACGDRSEVVRLSSNSGAVVNPFDVSADEFNHYGDEAVNNRTHFVLSFLDALKGSTLTAQEKTVADRVTTDLYRRYLESDKIQVPTLTDLDEELQKQPEEEARTIRLYIERYVRGSIKLFNGQSTVMMDKKLTIFDLSQLGSELKDTGMLALLAAIWRKVFENFRKGSYTWIYFDELHRYYRTDNSLAAEEIERLYAEVRKFGGIVTSMTQHPAGVLASPTAASMLTNSQFVVLFEQDDTNVEAMAERMKLNENHRRLLLAAETGEAVLRARNSTIAVKLLYPKGKVYDTITTDFKDMLEAKK
ncbi:MAG: ATP-binding protein [Clostridia bacterium]|nr:ATP-binding protein [Clostridia bacterium]